MIPVRKEKIAIERVADNHFDNIRSGALTHFICGETDLAKNDILVLIKHSDDGLYLVLRVGYVSTIGSWVGNVCKQQGDEYVHINPHILTLLPATIEDRMLAHPVVYEYMARQQGDEKFQKLMELKRGGNCEFCLFGGLYKQLLKVNLEGSSLNVLGDFVASQVLVSLGMHTAPMDVLLAMMSRGCGTCVRNK